MSEEPEITTLGEKGQVVIPQRLRKQLGMKAKTRFIVFGEGDTIVLRRLRLPSARKEWDRVFKDLASKQLKLSEAQVAHEVQASRRRRAKGRTA